MLSFEQPLVPLLFITAGVLEFCHRSGGQHASAPAAVRSYLLWSHRRLQGRMNCSGQARSWLDGATDLQRASSSRRGCADRRITYATGARHLRSLHALIV
jgi:hypothetical protein